MSNAHQERKFFFSRFVMLACHANKAVKKLSGFFLLFLLQDHKKIKYQMAALVRPQYFLEDDLKRAIEKGDGKIMKSIICKEPSLLNSELDENQRSSLHYACQFGNLSLVKDLLVYKETQINKQDKVKKETISRTPSVKITIFQLEWLDSSLPILLEGSRRHCSRTLKASRC